MAGRQNSASGQDAFATGQQNTASGVYSGSLGLQNTSSGAYAFTTGRGNTASADYATATGRQNTASAIHSTARGYRGVATFAGEDAVGCGLAEDSADGACVERTTWWRVNTTDATNTYLQNIEGGNALVIPTESGATIRVTGYALRDDNTQAQSFEGVFNVHRAASGDPLVNGSASDVALTSVHAVGGAA